MQVFPFILDARPLYLEGTHESLLQLPWERSTVVKTVHAQLGAYGFDRVAIISPLESDEAYRRAMAEQAPSSRLMAWPELGRELWVFEPSDWLLFIDPSVQSMPEADLEPLLLDLDAQPQCARHLVALENHPGGTRECVEMDAEGRVRRIQRYYDSVTWTFASAVMASLIPVSTMRMLKAVGFPSLVALRSALSAQGVPSRDIPIPRVTLDLTRAADFLRAVHQQALTSPAEHLRRTTGRVHPSARIVGPVLLHDGVVVEENATILGPALIGTGAVIGDGSVVAQCVVAPGTRVPPRAVLHQRVVCASSVENGMSPVEADANHLLTGLPEMTDGPDGDASNGPNWSVYPTVKAVVEAVCAAAVLTILLPTLLLIAIMIKLESRGPILYGDRREGRDGTPFRCYKFRTMAAGADRKQRELMNANQVDGPQFKMERDPRVTRLGRLLRATSLDELPQLLNVVCGQMSLVGPRPSPFRENQVCVPWREARLSIRPGITGLWQVCRHDRDQGDFHQWIYYDLLYVRHMSPSTDIKILLATLYTLGGRRNVPLEWIVPAAKLEAAA